MSVCASSNQPIVRRVLAEKNQEVDVVRYTESSHKSMIEVLIKAEMFIVGSQTINPILFYKDDIIDEWSSTS